MGLRYIVLGPPGTGKTRFGQDLVAEYRADGVAAEEIAYVAFTRAAALEAAQRCGVDPESHPDLWFRTLHSLCYRLLGSDGERPGVLTSKLKRQFARECGLELSCEDPDDASAEALLWDVYRATQAKQRNGDLYLGLYNLSRLCCRTSGELDEAEKTQHPRTLQTGNVVAASSYRNFVEVYEAFKRREGVIDYIDMLTRVLRSDCGAVPHWRVAVIDEAQDLAPLMWAVAERTLFGAQDVFLIGDDDQAIYSWMMANADDLLGYRSGASKVIVLRQTHRFGPEIVQLSARVAQRILNRHPKDVIPAEGVQNEILTQYQFDPATLEAAADGGTALMLHRHIAGCREIGARLREAGIPYWNERGPNPLAKADRQAYIAFRRLAKGPIYYDELLALLDVVPSRKPTADGAVVLVKHGAKKMVKGLPNANDRTFTLEDLDAVFSETFVRAVREQDHRWLDIPDVEYYKALVDKGFDLARGRPNIVVTTIHGSKGREADLVAVCTETFPKLLGQDGEHRVAYVAATRTRSRLWFVHERVVGNWTREYPYPL